MMNLPHPFESAESLEVTARGEIHLVNGKGRVLAALPLATAWSLSKGESGYGYGDGYGYGYGDGYGDGYGIGYGYGNGYGDGDGYGDESGNGFGNGNGYGDGYGDGDGYGTPKKTP